MSKAAIYHLEDDPGLYSPGVVTTRRTLCGLWTAPTGNAKVLSPTSFVALPWRAKGNKPRRCTTCALAFERSNNARPQ